MKKILVLCGGPSTEHSVSLRSAETVMENINRNRYQIDKIVISKNGQWLINKKLLTLGRALEYIKNKHYDLVFPVLHGKFGEDGTIQSILETLGLKYAGTGVLGSALAMNKTMANIVFRNAKLNVPDFFSFKKQDWLKNKNTILAEVKRWKMPFILKVANGGSSIGTEIIKKWSVLEGFINRFFQLDNEILIQKYIKGREVTCAVIEDKNGDILALPPTEIIPVGEFFDLKSKYEVGQANEITPPNLPVTVIKKIQQSAITAHSSLGCAGFSRTDFILSDKLWILEVNTIPGMTKTSLLPQAGRAAGISIVQLLDIIIQNGLKKK